MVNQVFDAPPQNQGGGGVRQSYDGPLADTKPHVMCPAAMLCVPKETCDFKGFITEQTLNLSPNLEMLRVPLIPCVNPDTQNIEVCCRDPNYVDPWPQNMPMPMGGKMMNGGKMMAAPAPAPAPAPQPPAPAQPEEEETDNTGLAGINPRFQQQQTRRKSSGGYGK